MPLPSAIKNRLVDALETKTLVVLCGAGLSMSVPSSLPSAKRVAEMCWDEWNAVHALDPALRHDIEGLAHHFWSAGNFDSIFIRKLVPWGDLTGRPNRGHAAVCDFLITRSAVACLSTNFDALIERWATDRKLAMEGALNSVEAGAATTHSPLLKFHGCMQRDKSETIWTSDQLSTPSIQTRLAGCAAWMNVILQARHLVVVGYWSDWGYLNKVIETAFNTNAALSVTVIDPDPSASLQTKAPIFWSKLNAAAANFVHVQMSADDALEELWREFLTIWLRRLFDFAKPSIADDAAVETEKAKLNAATTDELYQIRQDGEGVPYTHCSVLSRPNAHSTQAAHARVRLAQAGGTWIGPWLHLAGSRIRVINAAGQDIASVRARYVEPAALTPPDVVVCAGGVELSVPAKIVGGGVSGSIVRGATTLGTKWLSTEDAFGALGI